MSDTIKTTLTADGSSVATELNRVAALYQAHASKIQTSQAAATANYRSSVTALRLEAAGLNEASAALREKIYLEEQARRLSSTTGMPHAAALQAVNERLAVEKQIEAQRAASASRAGMLPDLALTPQSLRDLQKRDMLTRQVGRTHEEAGKQAKNGAMGFLAFSQGVEDAQYGLNGVLNNVPQMVMGFGGSMGLAGAISLTVVAFYQLWKVMEKRNGMAWNTAAIEGEKSFKSAIEHSNQALRERITSQIIANKIASTRFSEIYHIEKLVALDQYRTAAIQKQTDALTRARQAQDSIAEARKAAGLDTAEVGQEHLVARARAMEDIATAQARLIELGQQYQKTWDNKGTVTSGYQDKKAALAKELENLETSIATSEARKASLDTMIESSKALGKRDTAELTNSREDLLKVIADKKALIDTHKAEITLLDELLDKTTTLGGEALKSISDQINAENEKTGQLREEIRLKEELYQIEKQADSIRQNQEWQNARIDSEEKLAEAMRETEKILEQQQETMRSRAEFAGNIQALQFERAGMKEKADSLRAEMDMRGKAVSLAKELNISEEDALAKLREKARLERDIARGKLPGGRPSNIRHSERDSIYNRFGGSLLEGRGGFLRDSLLDKRGATRAAREAANKQESQAKYWEKQLDLQERLVKKFDKLGVV